MDQFTQSYPVLSRWVQDHGWVEIGYNDFSHSFVRVPDIGGMVWEGASRYPTLDAAFQAAEAAVTEYARHEGLE